MPDREQPIVDPQLPTYQREFRFRSLEERQAFVRGVRYVNDSAVIIVKQGKVRRRENNPAAGYLWYVIVEDQDARTAIG